MLLVGVHRGIPWIFHPGLVLVLEVNQLHMPLLLGGLSSPAMLEMMMPPGPNVGSTAAVGGKAPPTPNFARFAKKKDDGEVKEQTHLEWRVILAIDLTYYNLTLLQSHIYFLLLT